MPRRFREGTKFEQVAGYSRAVRAGNRIVVSGTADLAPDGTVQNPGDTYEQTLASLRRAVGAIEALGGSIDEVVLSRLYLGAAADWKEAARAHNDVLGPVAPANTTLFVHGFPAPGVLVEVELEAETDELAGGPAQARG